VLLHYKEAEEKAVRQVLVYFSFDVSLDVFVSVTFVKYKSNNSF
jgi:hypothetical protein